MQKQIFLFFFCIHILSFSQPNCFQDCAQRSQNEWLKLNARGVTSTDSALLINQHILEGLKGCMFPSSMLNKLDGTMMNITDLKGNVVFVHFWFTTCATCIAEMPSIVKLENDFKDEHVKFLAISFNDKAKLNAFFEKRGEFGSIQTYMEQRQMETDFCILEGYPLNLVLDKNGKVLDAWYEQNPETDQQEGFYQKVNSLIKRSL